jgi:VanZ family protein
MPLCFLHGRLLKWQNPLKEFTLKFNMRYIFIVALVLYWPFIFFLAHISELPGWVLHAQMSDKTMHYLGYLILVFLWWFSVFPSQKPSVLRFPLWLTLAILAVYGGLDEWLQGFTHRTPDIHDWAADMSGVLTGLIIFGVVGLRLSAFAITAFIIFVLTSLCKTDPLGFVPFIDILFYIGAYCVITLLWTGYLKKQLNDISRTNFFLLSVIVPIVLLIVSSIVASLMRKHFAFDRITAAVVGIILGIVISMATYFYRLKAKPSEQCL